MINRFFILIIVQLLLVPNLHASIKSIPYFNTLTNTDGLNQNTINCLHQDEFGFIWMGTPNGLIRYDGNEFKSFIHEPGDEKSLINSSVYDIYDDKKGKLWLSTNAGISIYSINNNSFLNLPEINNFLINGNKVVKIIEVNDNKKWILTKKDLLLVEGELQNISVKKVDVAGSRIEKDITYSDMVIYNGTYYILTNKALHISKRGEEGNFFTIEELEISQYKDHFFSKMMLDKEKKNLYVSTRQKILTFDLNWEKIRLVNSKDLSNYAIGNSHFHITNFESDNKGNIWVTTFGGGVIRYHNESQSILRYKHSDEDFSLSSNIINDILLEESGVVWFATGHGGISILDPYKKLFHIIGNNKVRSNSLSSNLVNDILIDSKNRLWVGHFLNGINISEQEFNLEKSHEMTFKSSLSHLNVNSLKEINNQIFIGTNKGLYIYDLKQEKYLEIKGFPSNINVVDELEGIDGKIIFSVGRKIYEFDLGGQKVVNNQKINVIPFHENLKVKGHVNQIFDNNKSIYFATNNGLFQYFKDSHKVKSFHTSKVDVNSLGEDKVFTIYRSSTNVLWIGTFGGGLHKCIERDNSIIGFERITRANGLPDNVIYSILEDKEGLLWLSTDDGIVKFNPKNNAIKIYDTSDGLSANNFRKSSYFKDQYGTLLMGSLKGVVAFNPLEIKNNPIVPNPQILHLKIRNEEIEANKKYDDKTLLTSPIFNTESITLPYEMNQITLELGALNPEGINNTKFAYRLKGIDTKWTMTETDQRHANYIKLPSGEYTFELKAYNSDGVESEEVKRLDIIIESPWYRTFTAYFFYLLILSLIIFGVTKYLSNMIRLQKRVLAEQKDKEHLTEINEAKLTFFTNISHELRTPLTLILSPLEKLAYDNRLHPELKSFVENININGQRLLNLTNSLIDFRKIGKGELKLKPIKQDIAPFVKKTADAFIDYSKDKNINYDVQIETAPIKGWFDKAVIERIMFNLLSNAFKYTPKGGQISFHVVQDHDNMVMTVEDNGIGIKQEEISHIFERFYNGENQETVFGSSGIGLFLVKQLLDLQHGTITVDSKEHRGTKFVVSIPTNIEEATKELQNINEDEVIEKEAKKDSVPDVTKNNKPKILVVDDNEDIRSLIHQLFDDRYQVFDAVDGEDGLEKTMSIGPDVLLLDINMPKMNGYELAEHLKGNPETSHISIIFLSALVDYESKKKALEKGGQIHISKPFSPYMLELQVNNLIAQKSHESEKLKKKIIMSPDKEEILTRDEILLKKIKEIIEENYGDDQFNIDQIADSVNMSYIQFYRKFKLISGLNANKYLREYRLKKAAHLLEHDDALSIREVMYTVGFNSQSYFTKAFKKQYAVTPAAYKKQFKKESDKLM
ncbi:hybrid sensor histidine kinase/response regulator transcription factor [Flammeovirga agarivorans]|uniref:histidine kinase n=1 Tax=Flammeovirga agarivorans TaxID=2726742 RepID=A0A7X8SNX3_9BACT|nr:hybrid sensor histidine kinase/response regulator transcription factor [Flammeovirga agarivorans]NLR93623.1 response regulator [Flammeovirga agarivorans]